jgi:hypothetical protein
MEQAHELCPYSRATRGNIDVALSVGGTSIERVQREPHSRRS